MATEMPTSRIIQKQTSGATPIAQRTTATVRSIAASTIFVPLCQLNESDCRAHTANMMMAMAEAAKATLFIAPAGFANIALYASHNPRRMLREFPIMFRPRVLMGGLKEAPSHRR